MDFFTAQHQAQQKSRWLVFWFILAVMSIIVLIYLAVTLLIGHRDIVMLSSYQESSTSVLSLWNGERFFWIFLLVGGGVAVASLHRIWQISRHGGALVATQLGGRMIGRETHDPAEKRLLNVADEMAIAAGIPAPVVFVLDEESGLNAFAAGLSTQDCVIGVTRGLLETMNRDELQGVIGHEISHIVNGDSRLNLRLIGVLFGIYAITIVGRGLTRARGRNAGPVVLFGLLLCAIGGIGLLCGRIIQAAVSREREYLADASAVQFTRHPDGLAAALGKLRTSGSGIQHPEATAASHLFFGSIGSSSWTSLFATHPPLADRIARLSGKRHFQPMDAVMVGDNRSPISAANPQAMMPIASLGNGAPAVGVPEEISSASIVQAQSLLANLPETLRQQAQCVTGATGIVGGLFLSNQPDIRLQQEKQLSSAVLPTARELHQWLSSQPEQGARYRLVWLDLVLPVLREESETKRQQLLVLAAALIRTDGRVRPSEFALYSLLRETLLPLSARPVERGELRLKQLDQDIANVLALIAHAGHEDMEVTEAAYQAAMACSPASASLPFPAKTELSLATISQALAHLALTAPPYRKRLLHACAVAVRHDGKITSVENELLRAFAQSLDCPAPLTEK
ncbi:MAG: M48 family metallopeptidase [Azoarcus sp.]|nr:M48 family metallopeptidase [Azoarcus sp.]